MRLAWDRLVGFGPSPKPKPKAKLQLKPHQTESESAAQNIDLPKLGCEEVRGLFRRCPISEIFCLISHFAMNMHWPSLGREMKSLQRGKSSLLPESFVWAALQPRRVCRLSLLFWWGKFHHSPAARLAISRNSSGKAKFG